MEENNTRKTDYFILLGAIFIVGACLRLYLLSSQIFLDDEWHGIIAVLGKSYAEVLTQFNPVDNTSLPLNLYDLALYRNFGWSETALRLPVIIAGLTSLIVLPMLVEKIFNRRVSLIFAGLLAVSPVLIFYSRFARGYELAVLLGYSALLLACLWLKTGQARYAIGYALAGVGAVYAHLFALVNIFMPLALALAFKFAGHYRHRSPSFPAGTISFRSLWMTLLAMIVLLLPLMWPVFLERTHLPWEGGKMTLNAIGTATGLLAGTSNIFMEILFIALSLSGVLLLLKNHPLPGWLFMATTLAYFLVLLVSRPKGLDNGGVMLRYMIVVVPMALTAVAVALEFLIQRMQEKGVSRILQISGAGGVLGVFFVTGPLLEIYLPCNNFTNHSAYQGSYKSMTWEVSRANSVYPDFSIGKDQVPAFYFWLKGQTNLQTIIEYPFDICDYNDLLYYYQHFHECRVIAGYCSDSALQGYNLRVAPSKTDFSLGILSADQILSRVADPSKLRFRNLLDVTSHDAILDSKADILVLHKYINALKIMKDSSGKEVYGSIPAYYRSVKTLLEIFERDFGPPVYEDEQIICFRITPNTVNK